VRSVAFVSLGCAKNLVDTEVMIAKLGAAGWELEADAQRADTVVINTCAFIDPAKEESTHVILEHAAQKRRGQQLVVAGCLAQRYGAQLQSLVPEIDGVVGTGAYATTSKPADVRCGSISKPSRNTIFCPAS
jgi:ribosomal protein S12 methylthiotransferase